MRMPLNESIDAAIAALKGLSSVDAVFYAMKANPHREIVKLAHDGPEPAR